MDGSSESCSFHFAYAACIIRVGKIPTLLVLTWCVSEQLSTLLVLSLIVALVMLLWVTQLKPLMIFSSRVNILWGVIGCITRLLLRWTFLLTYLVYLWLFFELWLQDGLIRWVSLLGLSGLPPSLFFFMKALLVLWIGAASRFILLILFITRTIILFSSYLHWVEDSLLHKFNTAPNDLLVLTGRMQLAACSIFILIACAACKCC